MGVSRYTLLLIVLAVESNLVLTGVLKQGLLGNLLAILFLILAAISTGKRKAQK
ncbi:hypothetical protein ACQKL5_13510 [Peribacillus sp. NPDC097675]|uniref:hypothetical protein n=1 Tax=Peribacillus sp. NPDC097675 TaxID=3390618 RepID=UPI003D06F803